jgi:hypothetical protein
VNLQRLTLIISSTLIIALIMVVFSCNVNDAVGPSDIDDLDNSMLSFDFSIPNSPKTSRGVILVSGEGISGTAEYEMIFDYDKDRFYWYGAIPIGLKDFAIKVYHDKILEYEGSKENVVIIRGKNEVVIDLYHKSSTTVTVSTGNIYEEVVVQLERADVSGEGLVRNNYIPGATVSFDSGEGDGFVDFTANTNDLGYSIDFFPIGTYDYKIVFEDQDVLIGTGTFTVVAGGPNSLSLSISDSVAPVITGSIVPEYARYTPQISFDATDDLQLTKIEFSIGTFTDTEYLEDRSVSTSWDIASFSPYSSYGISAGDNDYTITVYDEAGNSSQVTGTINCDDIAPTVSMTYRNTTYVDFTVTDGGSGIAHGMSPPPCWTAIGSVNTYIGGSTYRVNWNGKKYCYIYAVDRAGNESSGLYLSNPDPYASGQRSVVPGYSEIFKINDFK